MARILLALVVVVVLAVVAGAFSMWRYPLEIADALARRSLKQAGFVRATLPTPHGALSFWYAGTGSSTVILLHGGADEGSSWAKTAPALTVGRRVVVPDLPGHGESEPKQGPLPVGLIVESIATLVEQEAARGPVTLVGNSLGGWTALHLALRKPGKVGRLVLEDAGGMTWLGAVPSFQPMNRAESLALFKATTGPDVSVPPGFVIDRLGERLREGPMSRLLQADVVEFLLLDELARVRQRADLIWGDHDKVLPIAYAEEMARRLPNAELHVMARAGHVPHREKPREFNDLLLKIMSAP